MRFGDAEARVTQRRTEERPLRGVPVREAAKELRGHLQQRDCRLLERRRRLNHERVVDGANRRRQVRRRQHPTNPPPGGVGRLRDRVDDDRPLPHAVERGYRTMPGAVEDDVLVDLIRDDQQVVLLRNIRDQRQLHGVEHLPRRILRRVQDEKPGACGYAAQLVRIDAPPRPVRALPQGHEAGRQPEHLPLCRVHLVERLHHDDAVPATPERGQRGGQPFGGTEHDRRLRLRVRLEAAPAVGVRRDRASQLRQPEGVGILVQLVRYAPAAPAACRGATPPAGCHRLVHRPPSMPPRTSGSVRPRPPSPPPPADACPRRCRRAAR